MFLTEHDIDRWLAGGYLGCTGTEAPSSVIRFPAPAILPRIVRRMEQVRRLQASSARAMNG